MVLWRHFMEDLMGRDGIDSLLSAVEYLRRAN